MTAEKSLTSNRSFGESPTLSIPKIVEDSAAAIVFARTKSKTSLGKTETETCKFTAIMKALRDLPSDLEFLRSFIILLSAPGGEAQRFVPVLRSTCFKDPVFITSSLQSPSKAVVMTGETEERRLGFLRVISYERADNL